MRRTIRIDEHGHVRMEGNPQKEVWMTLAEIADLFNLPAATVSREVEQAGDASFIETRADLAATAYEPARREVFPIEGAPEPTEQRAESQARP